MSEYTIPQPASTELIHAYHDSIARRLRASGNTINDKESHGLGIGGYEPGTGMVLVNREYYNKEGLEKILEWMRNKGEK